MSEKSVLEMVGGKKHINPHYNINVEKMDKDEINEEELFCKLFPEYAVNGKPLSPYFDLFESGYEQAEKRIADLERKLEQTEKDLSDYQFNYPTIKELQKENADLKKDKDYFSDALDKQIEATLKIDANLKKAKEIIECLLNVFPYDMPEEELDSGDKDMIKEAEEFLNSEVEK